MYSFFFSFCAHTCANLIVGLIWWSIWLNHIGDSHWNLRFPPIWIDWTIWSTVHSFLSERWNLWAVDKGLGWPGGLHILYMSRPEPVLSIPQPKSHVGLTARAPDNTSTCIMRCRGKSIHIIVVYMYAKTSSRSKTQLALLVYNRGVHTSCVLDLQKWSYKGKASKISLRP